jgi:lipopolysaccharide/colanic/teichoic acid biosynthesis glycosyltransferase
MKEEQDKQNVSGAAQPKEESKTKKYIRIAFSIAMLAIIALIFVMAALKR